MQGSSAHHCFIKVVQILCKIFLTVLDICVQFTFVPSFRKMFTLCWKNIRNVHSIIIRNLNKLPHEMCMWLLHSAVCCSFSMLLVLMQSAQFKGAVPLDFLAFFLFHESMPSGPLINRLKWFCLKVRFHGDIHEKFDTTQCLRRVRLCTG